MRAAVGAVQASPSAPAAGARPAAPHVRAAVGAAQARIPAPPRPPAQVQARIAGPAVRPPAPVPPPRPPVRPAAAIQPKVGFEYEIGYIKTEKRVRRDPERWAAHSRGEVIKPKAGYDVTADSGPNGTSQIEFIIKEVDENNRADCARAVLAARNVLADVRDLGRPENEGEWVNGDQTRIRTSRSHRFMVEFPYRRLTGQLQATAGLSIARLPEVVSGRAADQPSFRRNPSQPVFANYSARNHQPVWHAARTEVRRFPLLDDHQQEVLASVVTLVAQVPLALRNETLGGQGMFTAKTDFSKILAEAFAHIGRPIRPEAFETVVVNTINAVIRQGLFPLNTMQPTDGVFPAGYRAAGVPLGGLSLRQWLRRMVPSRAGQQGQDLMTPQNFPGTRRQREQMRAFGRMGNQVDPGSRPIIEFRNLTAVYHPEGLPQAVEGVLEYVRQANAPPAPARAGWRQHLGTAALFGGLLVLHHLSRAAAVEGNPA